MANTSATWQQAAHTTYRLIAAQHEPYKKDIMKNSLLLMKNVGTFSGKVRRTDY